MFETGILSSPDGTRLFYRALVTNMPKMPVVVTHGFAEHSGRYEEVMESLAKAGFAPLAFDLRGHGKSDGKRGYINRFEEYLEDLEAVAAFARTRYNSRCIISLGHSMGGLIAARHALAHPKSVQGLILSSPLFGIRVHVPGWKKQLGHVMSRLLPAFSMPNDIDAGNLTHDKAKADMYRSDPLIFRHVCARWFDEILRVTFASSSDRRVDMPLLLQLSEDDRIVSCDQSRAWFDQLEGTDKTLRVYDGFFHEIYNERERARPIGDFVSWLHARWPQNAYDGARV